MGICPTFFHRRLCDEVGQLRSLTKRYTSGLVYVALRGTATENVQIHANGTQIVVIGSHSYSCRVDISRTRVERAIRTRFFFSNQQDYIYRLLTRDGQYC